MEYIAKGKNLHQSPRKLALIASLMRGKDTPEARRILKFSDKKGALMLSKVLESAVANAKNLGSKSGDSLKVSEVLISSGQTYKRVRFGARGRVKPILKRTSHITIKLQEIKEDVTKNRRKRGKRGESLSRSKVKEKLAKPQRKV